jgi:hypothetical protein
MSYVAHVAAYGRLLPTGAAVATSVPRQSDHAANVAAGGRLCAAKVATEPPFYDNPITPPTSRPGGEFSRREGQGGRARCRRQSDHATHVA